MKRSMLFAAAAVLVLPAVAAAQPPRPTEVRREVQRERARDVQARQLPASQTERVTRTFTAGELHLSNLAGNIVVTRGRGREISVEAVKVARGRDDADARAMLALVQVQFSERGNRAEVTTVYPNERAREQRRNINVSVAYTVTAPENTRLVLRSLSGDLSVTGIKGELSAVTMSGDVTITDAGRLTSARSTSGDVQLTDVTSEMPLEAQTVSGDVVALRVRAPRVELTTISGDVRMDESQAERVNAQTLSGTLQFGSALAKNGRYTLKSHSGDVRIVLTGGGGFELDASTFSGTVRSDVELKGVQPAAADGSRRTRTRSLRGVFGDGSAIVDVTTFSGNVIVVKK